MNASDNPFDAWDPAPLAVGDRVQVALSGECEWCHTRASIRKRWVDDPWVDHGRTGRVSAIRPVPGSPQHRYEVLYDREIAVDRPRVEGDRIYRWIVSSVYARSELRKIDHVRPPDQGGKLGQSSVGVFH